MVPRQTGYGAVETNLPQEDTESLTTFQESDMLYVRERKLTKEERFKKIALLAFPLIVAAVIVLGFASFLLKDFGHLYPGRGGEDPSKIHALSDPPTKIHAVSEDSASSSSSSSSSSVPLQPRGPNLSKPTTPEASSSSSSSSPKESSTTASSSSSSGSGGSSCSSHKACDKLELTGDCCPTVEGIMLGCCN